MKIFPLPFFLIAAAVCLIHGASGKAAPFEPYGMDDAFDRGPSWGANGFTDAQVKSGIEKLAAAGIHWYRGVFTWSDLEPTKGSINNAALERQDLIYTTLQVYGIKEYMQLGAQPKWASQAPDSGNAWAYPPVNLSDWEAHVTYVATRFKGKITYWEIGNEQDWIFWMGTLSQFSAYLKTAYLALKKVDPNNQVLIGGLASDGVTHWSPQTPGAKTKALEQLYAAGAKDYFDIMNLHGYPLSSKEMEDKITVCYKEMARFGDSSKPLWITEIGYSTQGNSPAALQKQAGLVRDVYTNLIKHPKVEKVFWYNFRCKSGEGDSENNFGILNSDLTPRPAYDTLVAVLKSSTGILIPNHSSPRRMSAIPIWPWSFPNLERDALGRVP